MLYKNKNIRHMKRCPTDGKMPYAFAWTVRRLGSAPKSDRCLANVMRRNLVRKDESGRPYISDRDGNLIRPSSDSDYLVYFDKLTPGRSNPETVLRFVPQKEFRSEFRRCGV